MATSRKAAPLTVVDWNQERIDLACPQCGYQFKETVGRLQKHPVSTCPGCHQAFKLNPTALKQMIRTVEATSAAPSGTLKKQATKLR